MTFSKSASHFLWVTLKLTYLSHTSRVAGPAVRRAAWSLAPLTRWTWAGCDPCAPGQSWWRSPGPRSGAHPAWSSSCQDETAPDTIKHSYLLIILKRITNLWSQKHLVSSPWDFSFTTIVQSVQDCSVCLFGMSQTILGPLSRQSILHNKWVTHISTNEVPVSKNPHSKIWRWFNKQVINQKQQGKKELVPVGIKRETFKNWPHWKDDILYYSYWDSCNLPRWFCTGCRPNRGRQCPPPQSGGGRPAPRCATASPAWSAPGTLQTRTSAPTSG